MQPLITPNLEKKGKGTCSQKSLSDARMVTSACVCVLSKHGLLLLLEVFSTYSPNKKCPIPTTWGIPSIKEKRKWSKQQSICHLDNAIEKINKKEWK